MPNLPSQQQHRDKVRLRAYPTEERAGVIWAYLGRPAAPPTLPDHPLFRVSPHRISTWCMQRECNYLQALEGDLIPRMRGSSIPA